MRTQIGSDVRDFSKNGNSQTDIQRFFPISSGSEVSGSLPEIIIEKALLSGEYNFTYIINRRSDGKYKPKNILAYLENGKHFEYLCEYKNALVKVSIKVNASVGVKAIASTLNEAKKAANYFLNKYPEAAPPAENKIEINYWVYNGDGGGKFRSRKIDSFSFSEIEENYDKTTRDKLAYVLGEDFKPGLGGQLLLFHGPAGTW